MDLSEEEYVLELIERLKPYLPMSVHPGKSLIARCRTDSEDQPNIKLKKDQRLTVTAAQ